jgi:hypothetical protein
MCRLNFKHCGYFDKKIILMWNSSVNGNLAEFIEN